MRLLAPIILSLAAAVPSAWEGERMPAQEYPYGVDARQRLDFWPAEGQGAPVILYIHGGVWSQGDKANDISGKVAHFGTRGYAFASMNYRLVPEASVEEQAADVASAIGWLHSQASLLGIDRQRLVLMGHSSGAHLAALVATDPAYLARADVPMDSIAGVILLDGAAYHVPSQIAVGTPELQRMRRDVFGQDVTRQMHLSPVSHTGTPTARYFLILHVNNPSAIAQSRRLGRSLEAAGTQVTVRLIRNSDHMRLNRHLGESGDEATRLVDEFLEQVVER